MSKVKLGKLEREEKYESDKQQLRDERDTKLKKLDQKKDSLNKHQQNVYKDTDERKIIRAEKRAKMQELRDKERGAIRKDRETQRIQRISNRENLSIEDAKKVYDARQDSYSNFKKPAMQSNLTTQDLKNIISNNLSKIKSKETNNNNNETNEDSINNNIIDGTTRPLISAAIGTGGKDPLRSYEDFGTGF